MEPLMEPISSSQLFANTDGDRLLSVREVAEILQVPVSWVYGRTRGRSANRIPGVKLGKYWRFQEREVWDWFEKQRGQHAP